jgi:hypothetical protein
MQLTAENGLLRSLSALLMQLQVDAGTTLAILGNQWCYDMFHRHGSTSHAQNPRLSLRQRARPLAQRFASRQEFSTSRQKIFAVLRELDAPAGTVEQAQSEHRLEFRNTTRKRRLRDVELRRGRGKAAKVRDSDESAKKAQVQIMRHWHRF